MGALGGFMKPYRGKYTGSVILSIFSVSAGLSAYVFVGLIASGLFSGSRKSKEILCFALLAAGCNLLKKILMNASTWLSHKAAYETLQDIGLALSEKMLRLPIGYFEENGSGRLKTILVDHIEEMEKTLAHMLPEMTACLLCPLLLAVWMFVLDWRLALCALIWTLAGFSVTCGMMKNYAEKYAGQIEAWKGMNQAVAEYVGGIKVIKNFGQADVCYGKYTDAVYGHAQYNTTWQKETQIWSSLGMAIAPFSVFPVLIAGLIFYADGTLTGGVLVLSVLLVLGIFGPLMNAMNYVDQLAQLDTNANGIRDILDVPELKRGKEPVSAHADVEFSQVTFSYEEASGAALCDVSFHVPEGTVFALVGPSGSGKSTVAKLLAGYFDPQGGEIRVGGKPLCSYSKEALCDMIAYVEQETFLFEGTILDNIRIGRPGAEDAEVINAVVRAGCDAFIRALPNGYQTEVGAAGGRLSGGERQRIAIARAMLKDAPIIILDEATSALDAENEHDVLAAIGELTKNKTVIMIAHRIQTVKQADMIVALKDGRIVQCGTHSELIGQDGLYTDFIHAREEAAGWRIGN